MPQAVVDPEELRNFARSLKKFNTELRDKSKMLQNQLHALASSWRDQEHNKFVDLFEQHMQVLSRFTDAADEHVPYLLRKAEHIEDYLQS